MDRGSETYTADITLALKLWNTIMKIHIVW